jgi:hypothetical protein
MHIYILMSLTNNDYKKILNFYNIEIPKSTRTLKIEATKILGEKLCRCIKKLDPVNEARSIGICTKTIFENKGLSREKFNCKGKRNLTFRKRKMGRKTRRRK